MTKTGISYLKLTAVVAVLAVTLIPSLRTSSAKNQPLTLANAVPNADLATEERAIAKYSDDLVAYEIDVQGWGKRAALASADLDLLQRRSDDLKRRLSGVQNSVQAIVRKLKAANEWDDVDTRVAASITDSKKRAFFKETSFKQQLEEASNGLTGHANEISSPLDNLRKKLTSRHSTDSEAQFVRASYAAPAAFTSGSLGCRIGVIGLKISWAVGGSPSEDRLARVGGRCHPEGTINPF
jgi:hypothetical protein